MTKINYYSLMGTVWLFAHSLRFTILLNVSKIETVFIQMQSMHSIRCLKMLCKKEQPTHVLVAFDAGKTTFRTEMYAEYKGGRSKTPGEFKEQMPYIRDLLTGLGVQYYELPNYEADDIIGTLAEKVDKDQFDVVVLSGDQDLTQLASKEVKVDITVKGVSDIESYTPEHVAEKYDGLTPKQIIDMKGLAGDASDNIPGVTKIGENSYQAIETIWLSRRNL